MYGEPGELKPIIFTDLDGTLLDKRYSFSDALPALNKIKKRGIPLIICTSKTRAEIEFYRKKLSMNEPFISENGGGIFIPEGYFHNLNFDRRINHYCVIELGENYNKIRRALKEIQKEIQNSVRCKIIGFGDMDVKEIMKICGLDKRSAELSKMREYDEPFIICRNKNKDDWNDKNEERILKMIEERGLNYTKGSLFYHIMKGNDKGKAVRRLVKIFRDNGFHGKTIALGDGYNDIPMLENVDIPVLIKRLDGSFIDFHAENLIKSNAIGPKGWNEVMLKIIEGIEG